MGLAKLQVAIIRGGWKAVFRVVRRTKRIRRSGWLVLLALVIGLGGCGFDLDWSGLWDGTCYDCRSVCEGTEGSVRDDVSDR